MGYEPYGIKYEVETADAKAKIAALGNGLIGLGAFADDSVSRLRKVGSALNGAGRGAAELDQSVGRLKAGAATFSALENAAVGFRLNVAQATADVKQLAAALGSLNGLSRPVGSMAAAAEVLARNAAGARTNVAGLGRELQGLGAQRAAVSGLASEVQAVQRKLYGAGKNAEDLGKHLAAVPAQAGGLKGVADAFAGVRGSVRGARGSARGLGRDLDSIVAKLAAVRGIQSVFSDVGSGLNDARELLKDRGKANLELRDNYRELANLQGKAGPDNAVVGGALRFRIATGFDDKQANDALRRFEGSLPSAVASGNITGNATSGVAGQFLSDAARTGVRVDLSGSTAGLLAAAIAKTQAVPDASTGLKAFGTAVDVLNRGDGDLTPLVKSLVNTAGGTVGKGLTFQTLPELAAAISTASLNASPAVAGTRVRQAIAGLGGFDKKQGDTLRSLGISPTDDLPTRVEKLAPLLENAPNRTQALADAGFRNRVERDAINQLYTNRATLRRETEAARKGVDPSKVRADNDRFFAGDLAQSRVAAAENDASKFVAGIPNEAAAVARSRAEANLRGRLEIDTPDALATGGLADNPITRFVASGAALISGRKPNAGEVPLFLGGKPFRDLQVDAEARRITADQARAAGVDPSRFAGGAEGGPKASTEEFTDAAAAAARAGGKNPFGTQGQTDALLRQLIRVVENQTGVIQGKGQVPPPLPRPAPRRDVGNLGPAARPPGALFDGAGNPF